MDLINKIIINSETQAVKSFHLPLRILLNRGDGHILRTKQLRILSAAHKLIWL